MAEDPAAEVKPDPGGPGAGISRYRQLASWIIGVLAAVAATLLAGTQLANIGQLSFEDDLCRLLAAGAAFVAGLLALLYVIKSALTVLRPVEISLERLVTDPIAAQLNRTPGLLPFGAQSVAEVSQQFNLAIKHPGYDNTKREKWIKEAKAFLDEVAYLKVAATFDKAQREMAAGAGVAAAAILVFAYAANPPKDEDDGGGGGSAPVVAAQPSQVAVTLNATGQEALSDLLGVDCVKAGFEAVAIGGDETEPILVTVPGGSCELARFSLPSDQGSAVSTEIAPTPADADEEEQEDGGS